MKIYFDNTLINSDYIIKLTQSNQLFNNQFRLGATLCKQVELDVMKFAVASQPTVVYIKDDDDNTLMHLFVDSVDEENLDYYSYILCDGMIKMNANYDWSSLSNKSVQNVLNAICSNILGTDAPTITYLNDLQVSWDSDITARDFISHIAEILGSYAIINADNELQLIKFKRTITHSISVEDCADFTLGDYHHYDRVVYDYGVATIKVPDDEHYTGDGDTYYINEDNILFTDDETYTRQSITEHVYNEINGFAFYNATTSQCIVNEEIEPGELFNFTITPGTSNLVTQDGDDLVTQQGDNIVVNGDNIIIPTIAQFDWDYNGQWLGGYSINVQTGQQEETEIPTAADKVKSIKIKVDRELGQIEQRVSDAEGNITQIIQDAEGVEGIFENYQGVKYIDVNVDGITIKSNEEDATELNLDNDGVFINDAQGNEVAAMQENTFRTSEWLMTQTKDNTVFNIFRRSR